MESSLKTFESKVTQTEFLRLSRKDQSRSVNEFGVRIRKLLIEWRPKMRIENVHTKIAAAHDSTIFHPQNGPAAALLDLAHFNVHHAVNQTVCALAILPLRD